MRERLLTRLADFIYDRHRAIVIVGLIVTVIMAVCALRLELRLSFLELLDPESTEVRNINYINENFGGLSLLVVIVEAESPDRARAYADDLADALLARPDFVKRVFYKIDPGIFIDHALLFLDVNDLEKMARFVDENREEIAATLGDPRFNALVERLNKAVEEQLSKGTFSEEDAARMDAYAGRIRKIIDTTSELVRDGPDANIESLQSELMEEMVPEEYRGEINLSDPYFTDPTGTKLLMLVRASRPTDDFEWNTLFMEAVEAVEGTLEAEYPEIRVRMTGDMAVMRDERRVITRDMKVITSVTFIGVLILFAIGFRGLGPLGMVALSLSMGITWTFGMTWVLIGYLNVITSVFASIILGMGIDYAILMLTRYTEERAAGFDPRRALELTMTQTGKGILTGALATACAFYAMGIGSFRAAKQMGLIAGNGIFIYCAVMMLILPSIMVWRDITPRKKAGRDDREPLVIPAMMTMIRRGWVALLPMGLALFAFLSWQATKLEFEYDYTKIEAKGLPSMDLLMEMPKMFGWGINYGMLFSTDIEQDRQYAKKLRFLDSVSRVQAISDFIPENQDGKLPVIARINKTINTIKPSAPPPDEPMSPERQADLVAGVEHLRAMFDDMQTLAMLGGQDKAEENIVRLKTSLDSLLAELKDPDQARVRKNLGYLENRFATDVVELWERLEKMTLSGPLTVNELPTYIKDHFIGRDGKYGIYAFPSDIIWNEFFMEKNVVELKSVSKNASGISVIFLSILTQVKHDFLLIGAGAFLAVLFVLLIDYKNAYFSVLTMIPLVVGAVMMVGVMALFDIKLNFVNMTVIPLIMGIGIDYGVYMVHRWKIEGMDRDRIDVVIRSTGRGVIYSALTTIVGFGSLSLASYQGLQSLGKILVIGIFFCLLTAVVGLPSLYYFIGAIRKK